MFGHDIVEMIAEVLRERADRWRTSTAENLPLPPDDLEAVRQD